MDAGLIRLLLSNAEMKSRFFVDVDGVLVFDKIRFGWVVNNRQFLPDSYTAYKNRIGLADSHGNLIYTSNDVVLAFPYKDCVLSGGQTKDDQKRNEVFFNKTLAPKEIDRLLYPKVLVGAKRYSASGAEEFVAHDKKDNLIIKGNNLLAISSLLKRYEGEAKCIYIDVPYNTGNDSFGYNDRLNHSTWLTFIINRLEIAHRLLCKEGTVAISVDNYEIAYLLVLLDEVFGKENRKNIITGNMLGNCQIYPANFMREFFGWTPLVSNPLVWIDHLGDTVLRFERIIYPRRETIQQNYIRQPMLFRWIVDKRKLETQLEEKGLSVRTVCDTLPYSKMFQHSDD